MGITYINKSGERINIKQLKPFFLKKVDGTAHNRQTVNTFKAPHQDGAFFISSTIDIRNITIEGTLISNTPEEMSLQRNYFLRIFSPKEQGVLIYKERQIECVVEEAGFISSNISTAPNFFVSLLCPSVFFESVQEVRKELAMWSPLFSFELEIPQTGIEFALRQPSQIITVDNIGDVSCGCTVEFNAIGSVTNPELLNLDTGEFIRLETTMVQGESIKVYTHFAGKRIIKSLNQTQSNAFPLLSLNSTFIQLSPGKNVLRYDALSNMDLLEVSLYFRPRFLGA